MHAFSALEKVSFLIGAEISNIVLQPFSFDIRFVDHILLVVERGIEYVDEHGRQYSCDPKNYRDHPLSFHALIQDRVARVSVEVYRLTLTFESKRQLIILSDDSAYECGHIAHGDDLFVF